MSRVQAVIDFLNARRISYEVLKHEPAYTAAEEAEVLHVPRSEVLKTLVIETGVGHVIALLPASRKLDMGLLREALGDHHARLATESEITEHYPAFELGATPPVGALAHVPVFVDPEILQHRVVVFAESQTESVMVAAEDLFAGEFVTITPLAQREVALAGEF